MCDARPAWVFWEAGMVAQRVGEGQSARDDAAEVHARLTREGLPMALRGLALVYFLHTVFHVAGQGGAMPVLGVLTLATAAAAIAAATWIERHPPGRDRVHVIAGIAAFVILINIGTYSVLRPSSKNSIDYALFIVAAGAALLDPRTLAAVLTGAMGLWVALSLGFGDGRLDATAALHLVVATMVSVVLRLAHGRSVAAVLHAEARQREAEKLEAIGRLAGGVAHDFNNLLTVIRINARYAMGAAERHDDAGAHADLRDILVATDRAAKLTQELLAFSRRQMLSPRVIDLGDAIDELARTIERLVGERVQVRVRREAPGVARADLDPQVFERILLNLAANARDAMPTGGTLTLETRRAELGHGPRPGDLATLAPGPYVLLRVSDTGVGMDPVTLARVFEPFFTTKGQGGTGLGLATVYGAIKQSGGGMTVSSAPGRGACFEIWLPCAAPPAAAVAPEALPVKERADTNPGRPAGSLA
jgi:signal transduction histidine kinase